jgi:predicted phage baseplate assembly protein
MALTIPKLDDRNFQDIVDEAKKRIPHYCKEWTDHNLSDPGVTLIELFAWMTDIQLYRMNQVPDLHYIKLMEMLGINLSEPVPAKVPVAFWLSQPQATSVSIPANTEVASTQTESERSIVFTTDEEFRVELPELSAITSRLTSVDKGDKRFRNQNLRGLAAGLEGLDVFSKIPQVNDAIYFGFKNDLSHHILGFDIDFDPAGGAGIDPTLPPYIWEASLGKDDQRWNTCAVEIDTTKGMNKSGRIQIHLPEMGDLRTNKKNLYWVRARIREISSSEIQDGMRPYQATPIIRKISVNTWGGTTSATHAQYIHNEFLGQSDGSPGQRFNLKFTPLLKRGPDEVLSVHEDGKPRQNWTEVVDFSNSGAEDQHYTLDCLNGEIRFGPAIRQPDGTIKLYGAVPPRGSNLTFLKYRYGGGQDGNVQPQVINTLKTAIPYIARVNNREPAWGGMDTETVDAAKMRVPSMLRSRERAVTEDDFEYLAKKALPAAIGRVKCLAPRPTEAGRVAPGQVFVLVIPRLPNPAGKLSLDQLSLNDEDITKLTNFLNQKRLLTVRLDVRSPAYYWVSTKVQLRPAPGEDKNKVEAEVLSRLFRFLNPLTGGQNGSGWPFGRDLFVSDVYQCLQGIPNVQFIRNVEMFVSQPDGEPQGNAIEFLEIVAHGVIVSGTHSVEFI